MKLVLFLQELTLTEGQIDGESTLCYNDKTNRIKFIFLIQSCFGRKAGLLSSFN